ncbi:hypothetical protein S40285_01125 [Stachybotrys chlorohalonatus IBT 40285]|uniref:PhoD-like phosphatase domain-containing protein n=1 Tax=Stachybotrys chlorohalonatus (strain IBT 40285) TaxID=1283841 RepID=A0A084QKA3_STAC4|nr:hypothetical protein S40285_01125 [Stachybotrys chlorohalonata IBT 40285]
MSSAPYWGQLPGPKLARDRRSSGDNSTVDRRHSIDTQLPHRSNRTSSQTATTETTFSPYQSPTASNFAGQGLAPRPPSYQRNNARGQPSDFQSRSARQPPPDAEAYEDDEQHTSRGPPMGYHHPYGNGGLPYTYPTPGSAQPTQDSRLNEQTEKMETEHDQRPNRQPMPAQARDHDTPPAQVAGQSARPPVSGSSERRKKFAGDRSPLQRLELTLDSMTKEEKRARMQAAEQRARERARQRAAAETGDAQEVRDTRPRPSQGDSRASVPAPAPAPAFASAPAPALAPAAPITAETTRYQEPRAHQSAYAYQPQSTRYPPHEDEQFQASGALQPPPEPEASIPKRNLSFRERTARTESNAPIDERALAPKTQPTAAQNNGFSLTRSGSNKLKKDPPGDLWTFRQPPEPDFHPSSDAQFAPAAVPRSRKEAAPPREPYALDSRQPQANSGQRRAQEPFEDVNMGGVRRRATEPIHNERYRQNDNYYQPPIRGQAFQQTNQDYQQPSETVTRDGRRLRRHDSDYSDSEDSRHHISGLLFKGREHMRPGEGLYNPPQWLDEWRKATVGSLAGTLLDLEDETLPTTSAPASDNNKAWWEDGGRRGSSSYASRPRKAEAFDGEYDDTTSPTRFKPPLYLKCGPLLRYCGIRRESVNTGGRKVDREIWRGTVMIVTLDADSSYEIAPMLRLFLQDMELLPPPPHQVNGELPPEYVDPLAGHPKLGRRGETLYVRPVDHLEEAKDLSRDETDNGLFEATRSPPDVPPPDGSADHPGSFASRKKRIHVDGEKMRKYKDTRGFRLHAERGYTFWRFNIEVELRDKQQRVAYRVNRGPANGFWVPARGQAMNMMFYSCNGFSASVERDEFSGPDPMWRDVLNTHQTRPFHVMIGGGDQIYNDPVGTHCKLLGEWLAIRHPLHKHNAPFSPELQNQIEEFYLQNYCTWFSQGLFGLANSQIPMVNMYDDHDIFDGYGSYPHHDMNSPVMSGLGAVGFKYYMLFQHQSIIPETQAEEPSWILGDQPGPYINEVSRSLLMSMGGKVALLAVDCRTERTEHDVLDEDTWEKILDRIYEEVFRGQVEHLLVVLGVPIAYPRLVWLENILTSRLMDPIKALGRTGVLGKVLNNIDGGVEVLDDLNDHWTARNHKEERKRVIEQLQDLAIDKSIRVTILSGDVHLAAVGQFYSKPSLGLPKHKDARYMPNVVSSAIVNAPPADMMADVINRRNKIHHFDKLTEEDMIPIFQNGVDGKPRNNKHLLPHRNWCSIRQWEPGTTPPPTPPLSPSERSPSPPAARGGLLRRLSLSRPSADRPEPARDSVRGSRPPISGGGSFFRSLSRRNSTDQERPSTANQEQRPAFLTRTLSLGRGDSQRRRPLFSFGRGSNRSRDDGGTNGQWQGESEEEEEEEEDYFMDPRDRRHPHASGLRGGAAYDEYSEGDEEHFTVGPQRRAQTWNSQPGPNTTVPPTRPFHRTPTGLSVRQKRQAAKYEVDLEGGLDICLNVEVNPKDPTGITVPYRLLVPKLSHEYNPQVDDLQPEEPSGFQRLLSFRRKGRAEEAVDNEPGYMAERAGIQAR